MFAYSSNSTLKNFGINNSYIKSSTLAAASVVAEGFSITLKNIYSNATIDGKKNSAGIAGAIAGNISNVYNLGTVNSNSTQFAAGVVGYLMWSSSKVKNSYNVAKIYGSYEPGGIVGGSPAQILNVYNLGVVLSSSAGGGIVGQLYDLTSPKVHNSYNIGTADGGIVGNINQNQSKFKLENNYYLTGTASYGIFSTKSNDNAEPLSADEMPSVISVINGDNAFVEDTNNINNGYPILKWQAERENN